MSLNRNEKATVVTDVAAQVARSQTLALAEYRGMTVEHLNALRKTAREKGVYLHVLKNTLARRAVAGTPFEVASESMVGPLIYGFSEDAVAAAKVLSERVGTTLVNGNWFLRRLAPMAKRAVLMHGHRHIDWIGECGRLRIASAPSPVMNATDDRATYFYVHTLTSGRDRLDLLSPQRIEIPGGKPDDHESPRASPSPK